MTTHLEALVALALLGAALPALGLAFASATRTFAGAGRGASRTVAAATIAGAVTRAIVPHGIATVFIGYLLTQQAIELSPTSHYGIGSQALYHALFAFLPHDHATLMGVNAALGTLTIPLAAAVCARWLDDPRAGALMAVFQALTPLFVRNDTSDANNVPVLLFVHGGLVLLADHLERRDRRALLAAATLLTLAAVARPEMPLLAPVIAAGFTLSFPRRPPVTTLLRSPLSWGCLLASALLIAPHAAHVAASTDALSARGSLPGAARGGLLPYLSVLRHKTTLDTPTLYPAGLLALAAVGLATRRGWRARVAIGTLTVVCLLPYTLDLCRANMARVQVPSALFATMLAAAGAARLLDTPRPRAALGVTLGLVALSAAPTAATHWAPTNEAAEETFLRRALRALPAGPITLVRFDRVDRDRAHPLSDATHHHFPDYLVRPPNREGRVSSIRDFIDEPDLSTPAFFYQGMRCYAEFRTEGSPPPHGAAFQRACSAMAEQFVLEPVVTWSAPNRGDVWLEYYGDAPTLDLALFRVVGRRP